MVGKPVTKITKNVTFHLNSSSQDSFGHLKYKDPSSLFHGPNQRKKFNFDAFLYFFPLFSNRNQTTVSNMVYSSLVHLILQKLITLHMNERSSESWTRSVSGVLNLTEGLSSNWEITTYSDTLRLKNTFCPGKCVDCKQSLVSIYASSQLLEKVMW